MSDQSQGDQKRGDDAQGDVLLRQFVNDIPVYDFDDTTFTKPRLLAEAQVAIVTTAGLRTDGDTYWTPGDQAFTEIPVDADKLALAHFSPNFDRSGFMADPEVVFPVKRLAELAADGTIGSVAPLHYSFMGAQPDHNLETMRLDSGPACAERLKRDGTDVVVLTPI